MFVSAGMLLVYAAILLKRRKTRRQQETVSLIGVGVTESLLSQQENGFLQPEVNTTTEVDLPNEIEEIALSVYAHAQPRVLCDTHQLQLPRLVNSIRVQQQQAYINTIPIVGDVVSMIELTQINVEEIVYGIDGQTGGQISPANLKVFQVPVQSHQIIDVSQKDEDVKKDIAKQIRAQRLGEAIYSGSSRISVDTGFFRTCAVENHGSTLPASESLNLTATSRVLKLTQLVANASDAAAGVLIEEKAPMASSVSDTAGQITAQNALQISASGLMNSRASPAATRDPTKGRNVVTAMFASTVASCSSSEGED